VELTSAYCPAKEGGYTVAILEAVGVVSQGDTFEEARANLHAVVALMLEEAPHQFGVRAAAAPPGALLEKLFVLLPREAA
jgi:predicted RNase H-like HicB family nuclease